MAENSYDVLLVSGARTATTSSAAQTNRDHRGVKVTIHRTASAATPSVVPTIEGYDETSGQWVTLLTGAAITGTGTTTLTLYPGVTASANVAVSDVLPRTWRVTMTAADADSLTYSVGANLIL